MAFKIVGKRGTIRSDAYRKVKGSAVYTRDVKLPGMLYAKFLKCPYPHARIKHINVSKAKSHPGVVAVFTYEDEKYKEFLKNEMWFEGEWYIQRLPLVPRGECFGAVVVAETLRAAEEARRLIEVEYEELPFILDPEKALEPDAPILYPPEINPKGNLAGEKVIRRGDVNKGFAEADLIVEDKFVWPKLYYAGAEPGSYVFRWNDDGSLDIWAHTQVPGGFRQAFASYFGLPISKVNIMRTDQGASYGQYVFHMPLIGAALARDLKRPVKLIYDRSEDMFQGGDGCVYYVKIGVKKDGLITAIQMRNIEDLGERGEIGIRGPGEFSFEPWEFIEKMLICPNLDIVTYYVFTNKHPAGAMRCERNSGAYIWNKILSLLELELKMDPTEIALKNIGDVTGNLRKVIEVGKKAIGWDEKWHPPGTKRLPNGRMHGMGFSTTYEWGGAFGVGAVTLNLNTDGSVDVLGHVSEIGQDAHTAYTFVAAEELGIPIEKIRFVDTTSFFMASPGGSGGLATNLSIVRKAARNLKKQILEIAAPAFGVASPEELDIADGYIYVKVNPEVRRPIPAIVKRQLTAFEMGRGPVLHEESYEDFKCWQAHFCEVEVDPETGMVEVIRTVNVNDVGKAIRPESVEGQLYGGTVVALGRNITEESVYCPTTGVRLNDNLLEYKIPTILDCGTIDAIIYESGGGPGEYGNIGVGEATATCCVALFNNAVCNALGVKINENPVSPMRIIEALKKAK
ncbi:MAG: xanthine dehydrogenase family protein molybdopterin-binding subunit [candidate division WOR-3 bacterium]